MADNERILLIDTDEDEAAAGPVLPPWRVLVVDDDDEVHQATRYSLRRTEIMGRPLELVHTHSGGETEALLERDRDFSLILLDVVMESPQAGLNLVQYIREHCGMNEARIILRTGQPGFAPELPIIQAYDINDYRTKSELTQTRLITAATAALRSYNQIRTIAESRRGLEMIVRSAADLMERHAMLSFAEGVLTQLAALLGLPKEGIVCAHRGRPEHGEDVDSFYVISAAGRLASYVSRPLEELAEIHIRQAVTDCLSSRQHQFADSATVLYVAARDQEAAVFLQTSHPLEPLDRQLVEVFATNISAYFGNLNLIAELNRLAYYDTLTQLPNRLQFLRELDAQTDRQGQVLLLLDMQRFAELNNGLGHEVGNALLMALAQRLDQGFDTRVKLARLGSDVFGVLGPAAVVNAEHIQQLLAQPLEVGEHRLPVTVTLGWYVLDDHAEDGLTALRRASIALEVAKADQRRGGLPFKAAMEAGVQSRLALVRRLRSDLAARKLEVWYQPQVLLRDDSLIGMEALVRWPDGQGGMVQNPMVFVGLAEQAGLIDEMGSWVLDQAAQDWRLLQDQPGAPPRVSVNVSVLQFRSQGLTDQVRSLIARHAMPPGSLELEVTESVAMDDPQLVVDSLRALHEAGARVAMDDFGTGYSSLSQLRALPIDCLKVDRAFVSQIGEAQGDAYAETVIRLGQRIGMEIVAEGVETEAQAVFLRDRGCDVAQGWRYAKAMPLAVLRGWIEARRTA
ncbi:EAL domain-containing protein [Pelomonas sp. SE-A7]|uniref:putative bifunctional diguanylate cyclase/phosphodiesterase n=1 Tax=Pelomonas sp. SE-A7 TaxID=3054953 RepID=UPI00259C787E|nr:EAL domain-containing protein [Pelomonas sp. SE-A7]MDM4767887.1 EAL domain-containing protein [Pelomonas sp. SE-A7]